MKTWIFLLLFAGFHSAAAVTHSLKYFFTGSSQVPNFPEFVAVGMIDDFQIDVYDTNTNTEPKQDWMKKVTEEDPQYWEKETGNYLGSQQFFRVNIDILKQRFNQTGGVHVFHYLTQICPDWLKKYVNYGRSLLMRTAKRPPSPVNSQEVMEQLNPAS